MAVRHLQLQKTFKNARMGSNQVYDTAILPCRVHLFLSEDSREFCAMLCDCHTKKEGVQALKK